MPLSSISPTRDIDLSLQTLVVIPASMVALIGCFTPGCFFLAVWVYLACALVQLFSLGIHSTIYCSTWHLPRLLGYLTCILLYIGFPKALAYFEVPYATADVCFMIWVPLPILPFLWYYKGSLHYHRTWTLPDLPLRNQEIDLLDEFPPHSDF